MSASLSLRESIGKITADKIIAITILVNALRYFVDIFDLLFNIVRGLVIPMTMGFRALIPALGIVMSGMTVMGIMALLSLWRLSETFHADLDYIEGEV